MSRKKLRLPGMADAEGRSRKTSAEDDMDLTPMVDVTFLLLIFFMITAAFALQKALEVPPVADDQAASQKLDDLEVDSVVVRIDADNIFWIGAPKWDEEQKAPSIQDMLVTLREARESLRGKSAKLLVQANGDSRHEFVVAALDAGSGVGMEEIRLMSYEDDEMDF
ncbi:MAG: biopolymer transporter ExbD [Pirellulales bacterium]|nr:biopolymer transporter ExbD [Pirellulales bacterium]